MSLQFLKEERLSLYTTLKIGGVADTLVIVETEDELLEALQFAKQTAAPLLILGEGSNVLCKDEGFPGLVVINRLKGYDIQEKDEHAVLLKVGAGENLDEVVDRTIADSLWGLENLSSIPGSIGATPVQNVGAYGVEVSELIESVKAIHIDTAEQKIFSNAECDFGYRDSFFKSEAGKKWCVLSVTYALKKNASPVLHYKDLQPLQEKESLTQADIRQHVISVRANKFPDWRSVGTAGSFFKNPIISSNKFQLLQERYPNIPGHLTESGEIKVSLGWILDKVCDLRGFTQGNVRLYENQALVLIAGLGATHAEVHDFVALITQKVAEETGITIEREVLTK